MAVFTQLCNLVPAHLVNDLAIEFGITKQCRTFSPWSHFVALAWSQFGRSASLNDVCDTLFNHQKLLASVRGATPPSKNGLSHANKIRTADMAEALFWKIFAHLSAQDPSYALGKGRLGLPRRFSRAIFAVDSTTIQLIAECLDWAKHRRRKAAAKCHLRLDLASMLPAFVIIGTAKDADNSRARELCAGLKDGEVVIFDKAYVDYEHLADLDRRGVIWVTRPRSNMAVTVVKPLSEPKGAVLADEEVQFETAASRRDYPKNFRRVTARLEVDKKMVEMEFITNHPEWAPSSICELYQSRWGIESFFKQLKQNLKLCGFLGNNANAVRWQVWMALIVLLLLRYLGHRAKWPHAFSRLCTVVRGVLWDRFNLWKLLDFYGTAGGNYRLLGRPDQEFLPGFG